MSESKLKYAPSNIERAVTALKKHQITKTNFLKLLDAEKERLEKIKNTIKKEQKNADDITKESIKNEIDTGFMGIDTIIMAIEHLKKYEYDPRTIILDDGEKLAKRGQELVFKAAQMNEEAFDTIMDTAKDMVENPSFLGQEEMMISPY